MKLNPVQAVAFLNAYKPVYITAVIDGTPRRFRVARVTRHRNGSTTVLTAASRVLHFPAGRDINLDNGSQL